MDKTELETLFDAGLPMRKIGERLGYSLSTIRYWAAKYGLKSNYIRIGILHDREKVVAAVKNNVTIASFLEEMGLDPRGSNYRGAKRAFIRFGIDTSHFTRGMPRKGLHIRRTLEEILIDGGRSENHQGLKKRLLSENLLENKCDECEMGPEWRGKTLVLRLDHINGVPTDYRLENLRLLCPNCDSQTDTYCGRNKAKALARPKKRPTSKNGKCQVCKTVITSGCTYCKKCIRFPSSRKVKNRPSLEVLQKEIMELGYKGTGRKYGVSDNAIRKWVRWAQNDSSSS